MNNCVHSGVDEEKNNSRNFSLQIHQQNTSVRNTASLAFLAPAFQANCHIPR